MIMGMARRKAPGSTGKGNFYRINVRPKGDFTSFRVQDVGKKGGLERLAGHRASGSWDTVTWLIEKKDAHVKNGHLIVTGTKAKSVLKNISGHIYHVKGDIFRVRRGKGPRRKAGSALALRRGRAKS